MERCPHSREEAAEHASALLGETADYILGKPADAMERYNPDTARLLQEIETQVRHASAKIDPAEATEEAKREQEGSPLQLARSLLLLVASFVHNIREVNVPLAHTRNRRRVKGDPSPLPPLGRLG